MKLIKVGVINTEKLQDYLVETYVDGSKVWIRIELSNSDLAERVAEEIVDEEL